MCLKPVACFIPTVYNNLLIDLGTKVLAELFFNLDRFILCKQLFLCEVIRIYRHILHEFLNFYERVEEKGKKRRIKGKTMVQWINFLWNNNFVK